MAIVILIASLAVEFEALILTFDKTTRQRCEAAKIPIFYCSANSGMEDEASIFVEALDHISVAINELSLSNV